MVSTKTKTKSIALLALLLSTFILSIVSYITQQQIFAQGMFESEPNNQSLPLTTTTPTPTATADDDEETEEEDQKIILGDILFQ